MTAFSAQQLALGLIRDPKIHFLNGFYKSPIDKKARNKKKRRFMVKVINQLNSTPKCDHVYGAMIHHLMMNTQKVNRNYYL